MSPISYTMRVRAPLPKLLLLPASLGRRCELHPISAPWVTCVHKGDCINSATEGVGHALLRFTMSGCDVRRRETYMNAAAARTTTPAIEPKMTGAELAGSPGAAGGEG
eukprot:4451855-Prymnesium_polylepis.1